MYKKGFTLIELLVVIAIIGILSSVVAASVNSARSKGVDAAIKSSLSNIQSQAALYYENNFQNYGVSTDSCATATSPNLFTSTADGSLRNLIEGTSNKTLDLKCKIGITGTTYVVAAQLKSDAGKYFCVDSTNDKTDITKARLDIVMASTSPSCQ